MGWQARSLLVRTSFLFLFFVLCSHPWFPLRNCFACWKDSPHSCVVLFFSVLIGLVLFRSNLIPDSRKREQLEPKAEIFPTSNQTDPITKPQQHTKKTHTKGTDAQKEKRSQQTSKLGKERKRMTPDAENSSRRRKQSAPRRPRESGIHSSSPTPAAFHFGGIDVCLFYGSVVLLFSPSAFRVHVLPPTSIFSFYTTLLFVVGLSSHQQERWQPPVVPDAENMKELHELWLMFCFTTALPRVVFIWCVWLSLFFTSERRIKQSMRMRWRTATCVINRATTLSFRATFTNFDELITE